MADENIQPGSTEGQEAAPAGKSKIVLLATVALLLLGGAGAAWFFLFSGGDEAATEEGNEQAEARPPQGPVAYESLSPSFIVNFPHQGRQRYLQAELTVMSRDPAALAAVRQHMPVIRHNLITLFNAQLLLVFEDPTGVETLRQLATEEVKRILQEEIGRPGIEEVLFTTFVMQ